MENINDLDQTLRGFLFEDLSEMTLEAKVLIDDFAPVEVLRSRASF
jgi:hypothetical protein